MMYSDTVSKSKRGGSGGGGEGHRSGSGGGGGVGRGGAGVVNVEEEVTEPGGTWWTTCGPGRHVVSLSYNSEKEKKKKWFQDRGKGKPFPG